MSESTLSTVDVKGIAYGLETHDWGFRVVKPKTGEVYDIVSCDDPVEANRFGWSCTCPDHAVRHAGVPSNGCKHFQALQSAGLIDPPATPPVPPSTPSVVVDVPAKPKSKPKSRSRKETVEEKRIRLRQEARAGVREYPDEYRDELRSARERLAEKRANRLNQIRSNWGEHVAKVLDGDREFRRHYIENNWDDIKTVRRQWLTLPENVQRIQGQRDRQPVKHRLKFSLFGFQTPNERPYSGIEPTPIIHEQPTTPEDFRELAYALESARDQATTQAEYDALHAEYRRAFETALSLEDAADRARIESAYPIAEPLAPIDLATTTVVVSAPVEPLWTNTLTTALPSAVADGFSDGFYNAPFDSSRLSGLFAYLGAYTTGQELWTALAATIGDAPTDPTSSPDDSPERPAGDPGSILDVTTPNGFLGSLPPVSGASVDHRQPRESHMKRKAIERLPYGSSEQNRAADGFWDRYMAWMDRNDSIEGYRRFSATQYFRKVTLTDVWYMANQRWLYRRDLAEDVAKESAQPKLSAYRIRWRRTPRARRVVEWIGFGESLEGFRKEAETEIHQDNPQAVILSCEPTDDPRNA